MPAMSAGVPAIRVAACALMISMGQSHQAACWEQFDVCIGVASLDQRSGVATDHGVGGDVTGDQGCGGNNGAIADRAPRNHGHVAAEPDVMTHHGVALAGGASGVLRGVVVDVRADFDLLRSDGGAKKYAAPFVGR